MRLLCTSNVTTLAKKVFQKLVVNLNLEREHPTSQSIFKRMRAVAPCVLLSAAGAAEAASTLVVVSKPFRCAT